MTSLTRGAPTVTYLRTLSSATTKQRQSHGKETAAAPATAGPEDVTRRGKSRAERPAGQVVRNILIHFVRAKGIRGNGANPLDCSVHVHFP